jgi:hypothetical protein
MTDAITDAKMRQRLLWGIALRGRIRTADVPTAVVDAIVAEGRGVLRDGYLDPGTHPHCRQYIDEAAEAITRGMQVITRAITDEGPVDARTWIRRGAKVGVNRDHITIARQWLFGDGLTVTKDGFTRARIDTLWINPNPKPPAPPAPPAPKAPPGQPTPAPVPAPPVADQPEPEPKPDPEPEPEEPKPARVTTRTLAAAAVPAAATLAEDDADSQTLLRRLVFAAEVSAGLVSGPTRVRTPLGTSPLHDAQLRVTVVLAGAGRPLMSSEISRGWLTPEQKQWLESALADGVRRGAFTASGGRGKANRGARYSLADPTVFDASWEAVTAAVEAQRKARERRQVGSGAGAAAAS